MVIRLSAIDMQPAILTSLFLLLFSLSPATIQPDANHDQAMAAECMDFGWIDDLDESLPTAELPPFTSLGTDRPLAQPLWHQTQAFQSDSQIRAPPTS